MYIYIHTHTHTHKQETSVCMCMCCTTKNQKCKVFLTNFHILLILNHNVCVNAEIHNAYNLCNITNIVAVVPRENFTKET